MYICIYVSHTHIRMYQADPTSHIRSLTSSHSLGENPVISIVILQYLHGTTTTSVEWQTYQHSTQSHPIYTHRWGNREPQNKQINKVSHMYTNRFSPPLQTPTVSRAEITLPVISISHLLFFTTYNVLSED